jgi:hypothetical protein
MIALGQAALFTASAQDNLNQSLLLIRPYEPSVSDAQKITALPNLKDSFSIKPTFQYSIQSKRIDTQFDVTPIAPAKLQPLQQPKLYHGYVKVGGSTLPGALAEVAVNTVRNKDYAAGALFKFDKAGGKVKLDNREDKVFAGYNDISGKVFGQKFFRSSILYGDLGASEQTAYNYGYDTGATIYNPSEGDIQKRYYFADANIGLRSSHFKTEQLNYDVKLGYKFAANKLDRMYVPYPNPDVINEEQIKYRENALNFKAQMDNNMFGGNMNFDLYSRSNAFDSLRNNFAVEINPWFMLDNDSVRLKVGMSVSVYKEGDRKIQYGFFPKIEFQFTLLKDIFVPFVGIDGYLQPNTYRSIVAENPFITPGLAVPVTKNKLQIYAGLKGSVFSKLSYYLRGDFMTSDNEHFFVNDTSYSRVQNYFTVITDNLNTVSLKGELYFNMTENVDLGLKANYFGYNPTNEKKAWHKPAFTLDFFAKYILRDHNQRPKIIVNLDVTTIGKRYAKKFHDPLVLDEQNDFYTLNSVVVFNLGAEYIYTKSLSFFVKLNNLSGARYEQWNFYPSKRFNAMLGFTYSL